MKAIILIVLLVTLTSLVMVTSISASGTGVSTGSSEPVKLNNPLTGSATSVEIPVLLGKIISYTMGLIGSLALVMFIYGGVTWMLSAGNQEQVTKGKQTLMWAVLGLAIIFTSYALVTFVLTAIGQAQ